MKFRRPRFVPAVRLPAYGSLLAASFAILLLMPLFASVHNGFVFERILSGIMIVAAFVATGLPVADSWKLLAVLLPLFAVNALGDPRVEDATIVCRIGLLAWAEYRVLRQFLTQDEVGWDTVAAASAGFVLIAAIWANVFLLLEHFSPGSFTIAPDFDVGSEHGLRSALQYFSFVTLTTVGYGEIHPANVGSGMVSVAEALLGQLYLAVMISRIVGLHLAGSGVAGPRGGDLGPGNSGVPDRDSPG